MLGRVVVSTRGASRLWVMRQVWENSSHRLYVNFSKMEIVEECLSTYEGVGDTGHGNVGSGELHP